MQGNYVTFNINIFHKILQNPTGVNRVKYDYLGVVMANLPPYHPSPLYSPFATNDGGFDEIKRVKDVDATHISTSNSSLGHLHISHSGAENNSNKTSKINVLFIASEADPFIKVGGLADVAGSLPRALQKFKILSDHMPNDLDIRLAIPFHPQIQIEPYSPHLAVGFTIHSAEGEIQARAVSIEVDNLTIYLIGGAPIDLETSVYSADLQSDGYKYVFFSLAVLEMARKLGWKVDILHANDWHTAAAIYSLALHRTTDSFFSHTVSLLTVHNLPYLGSMTPPAMSSFGLPPADRSDLPAWARQMALPLGLLAADAVVAVSPEYAREIMTEEFGSGLDAFLKANAGKISGILNGVDTHKWDPLTDTDIAFKFSPGHLESRAGNKAFLQQEMDLAIDPLIPLLAMVTRMDPQKGVDLAVAALRSLLPLYSQGSPRLQMVFLGTGNPVLEDAVRKLERDYPQAVRARFEFNEALSHHIYAGADMLLMPSRYEPCGLSQMIAMHYGCVPVARATGGLCDTIQDPANAELGTGFLFVPATPEALLEALQRAMNLFNIDHPGWQQMQLNGMQQDFSWDRSAKEYLNQYRLLLDDRKKYNAFGIDRR